MKKLKIILLLTAVIGMVSGQLYAQDESAGAPEVKKKQYAKNTFDSYAILSSQTVMVPNKGTLVMDIQHRFGTLKNGRKDAFGIFAPSNIRLGLEYVPIKNLMVGTGLTKERMQWDLNAKYAILKQTKDFAMPVSVSYYVNMVMDLRDISNFKYGSDRLSYYHELMIACKVHDKFSVQVAPSISHFNSVEAFVNSNGDIQNKMKNTHLAISVIGRVKVSQKTGIIAGYNQPLTKHYTNNPHPNITLGIETSTSSHSFQIFAGNYYGIVPQSDAVFNQNDYNMVGQFLVGFNIIRLWSF